MKTWKDKLLYAVLALTILNLGVSLKGDGVELWMEEIAGELSEIELNHAYVVSQITMIEGIVNEADERTYVVGQIFNILRKESKNKITIKEATELSQFCYDVGWKKYHIEPSIWSAMIKQESGFQKNAKSSAGAIGLFQILPSTGAIVGPLLIKNYSRDKLEEPLINAQIGTYYLWSMKEAFKGKNGNMNIYHPALTAYCFGPYSSEANTYMKTGYSRNIIRMGKKFAIQNQII